MITARAWAGKHYAVYGLAGSGLATVQALLASGARVTAWDEREEARNRLLPGTGRGTTKWWRGRNLTTKRCIRLRAPAPSVGFAATSPFRGGFKDIRRALIPGEEIGTLISGDKALQRLHPRQQADKIILPTKREHRIDQIMTKPCFSLLNFEAVGEEHNNL